MVRDPESVRFAPVSRRRPPRRVGLSVSSTLSRSLAPALKRCIVPATDAGERGKRRTVELRQFDIAGRILEEPALAERDRRALLGADAEHGHAHAGGARTRRRWRGIRAC